MKKLILIVTLLVIVGGGAYVVLNGATPFFRSDIHIVKQQTERFFECVKFKEFDEASNYHNEVDREAANIPKMIEDLFKVPPEYLDIQDIYVLFADIDSGGQLAKSKTRCVVHLLNSDEIRKPEVILYWKKEGDQWFLKLRSSLERNVL